MVSLHKNLLLPLEDLVDLYVLFSLLSIVWRFLFVNSCNRDQHHNKPAPSCTSLVTTWACAMEAKTTSTTSQITSGLFTILLVLLDFIYQ